jgi:hypothetical protein
MDKKAIPVAAAIVVLLLLVFVGKPYQRQKDALKVVHTVLSRWKHNDLILAMSYWEKESNSPPVYDLLTYEVVGKEFGRKDGIYYARVAVALYFPIGNRTPSGREWVFELNKTQRGWKVIDFRLKE